jgi:hypothetical protein
MGVLGILGVVVVRGMRDLRVRIAVVSLANISAAVIAAAALGRRLALLPIDVLAGAVVTGDMGAASAAAVRLPAPPSRVAVLAGAARLHGLARIHWLVVEVCLNGWAGGSRPGFIRPVLNQAAMFPDLPVPDNRPPYFGVDGHTLNGEAARKELDELFDVRWVVQLIPPWGGHCAVVSGQRGDLGGGCRDSTLDVCSKRRELC